jgi:hypothetical protein
MAETTTPSTVLDEIAQLGERLDDLSVEEARPSLSLFFPSLRLTQPPSQTKYVGRESGLALYEAAHRHLSSDPNPTVAPSLVERLMQDESQPSPVAPTPPPDLIEVILDEAWAYLHEWPLMSRFLPEMYIASGLLETDRSFRSFCTFKPVSWHRTLLSQPALPFYSRLSS